MISADDETHLHFLKRLYQYGRKKGLKHQDAEDFAQHSWIRKFVYEWQSHDYQLFLSYWRDNMEYDYGGTSENITYAEEIETLPMFQSLSKDAQMLYILLKAGYLKKDIQETFNRTDYAMARMIEEIQITCLKKQPASFEKNVKKLDPALDLEFSLDELD